MYFSNREKEITQYRLAVLDVLILPLNQNNYIGEVVF